MKKLVMAFAILCLASAFCAEPDYYAALCAWAPGQIPSSSSSVIWGIRGTLFYGDCMRMNGLDLAIGANRTRERFDGLGIALVYNHANSLAGMELGFANVVERESYGLQVGAWNHAGEAYGEQRGIVNTVDYCAGLQDGFFNWANEIDGVQDGFINWAGDVAGVQDGTFNIVYNEMVGAQLDALWNYANVGYGVQWGVVNTADYFAGFQCGFFNWANDLDGFQLGFINVIANQSIFVFPFANLGF